MADPGAILDDPLSLWQRLTGGADAREAAERRRLEAGLEGDRKATLDRTQEGLSNLQDERDFLARQMASETDPDAIDDLTKKWNEKKKEINDFERKQGLASVADRERKARAAFDERVASSRQRRQDAQRERRANIKTNVKRGLALGGGAAVMTGLGYGISAWNQMQLRGDAKLRDAVTNALNGEVSPEDFERLVNEYGASAAEKIIAEGREAAAEGRDLVDEAEAATEAEEEFYQGDTEPEPSGLEPAPEDEGLSPTEASFMEEVRANPGAFPDLTPEELEDRINAEFDVGLENISTGLEPIAEGDMNFPQRAAQRYLDNEPILQQEGGFLSGLADGYSGLREKAIGGLRDMGPYMYADDAIEALTPENLDGFFTGPLDLARDAYMMGELTGVNETNKPVFREGLRMMDRQPLEAPAEAQRSPQGLAQDSYQQAWVDAQRLAGGNGAQPSTPNAYNAPQTYGDLLMLERDGMLPFPGGVDENAQRLGIPNEAGRNMQPLGYRAGRDTAPEPGQGLTDGGLSSGPPTRPTNPREVDPEEVIREVIEQDEVMNPRGQQAPQVMDEAPMPAAPPVPTDVRGPAPGRGLPFAAWAEGQDGSMRPATPYELEADGDPGLGAPVRPQRSALPGLSEADGLPQVDENPGVPRSPVSRETPAPAPQAQPRGNASTGTDYEAQKSADPASLADDAEEAEKELNQINTWMRDKLGMDKSERSKWGDSLIRMGATMMMTPGNLGEALGAGLNAGMDTYQGLEQQEYERDLTAQEIAMREADARRSAALDNLRIKVEQQKLDQGLVGPELPSKSREVAWLAAQYLSARLAQTPEEAQEMAIDKVYNTDLMDKFMMRGLDG